MKHVLEIDIANDTLNYYWGGEAVIPKEWIKKKEQSKGSKNYIKNLMESSDLRYTRWLYIIFGIIGVAYIIFAIFEVIFN